MRGEPFETRRVFSREAGNCARCFGRFLFGAKSPFLEISFQVRFHRRNHYGRFDAFFRPGTGVLSREIASGLGKGGSRANLIRFAQNVQNSVYPNGSLVPQYHFTVTAIVPAGMKTEQLSLDGTLLKVDEAAPKKESFSWPGKTHEAELRFGDSKQLAYGGTWAVFHLLGNYSWSASHGSFYLVSAPLNGPQGSTFRDTLDLKVEGVPLFKRGYLSQLRCTPSSSKR